MFGLITEEKHNEIVRGLKGTIAHHTVEIVKLNKQLGETRRAYDSCVELNEKYTRTHGLILLQQPVKHMRWSCFSKPITGAGL